MLIITTAEICEEVKENKEDRVIYNLSSLKEGYDRLDILPRGEIVTGSEKEFDILYSEYIMNNDLIFYRMFKPIYDLYKGKTVFLLVSPDKEFENTTESLTKFIQQRYGINAVYIYDFSDLDEYFDVDTNEDVDNLFTIQGLYNLDQDKERYIAIESEIKNK